VIDRCWQSARRILAIRLDNLGDVLLVTPAIRAIKSALPHASVSLLASPTGAQVGRLNPDIADVLVMEAPWVDPWQEIPHCVDREERIIELLRERSFDAAIIFTSERQSPLPAAYLCYLAGIPLRLAASIDASGSLLTTRHRHSEEVVHEVERGLDLVGSIGIPPADRNLVLEIPNAARAQASELRSKWTDRSNGHRPRPLVVVHPGSSMAARRYPFEQYAAVVEALVKDLDADVAITGLANERGLIASILGLVSPTVRARVHDVADTLGFPEVCALIDTADLVVTNNTGPMHIASAVGTPVISLFALTNRPEQWGPWQVPHRILNRDVSCRYCHSRICPSDQECLRPVSAADVIEAARELGIGNSDQAIAPSLHATVRVLEEVA